MLSIHRLYKIKGMSIKNTEWIVKGIYEYPTHYNIVIRKTGIQPNTGMEIRLMRTPTKESGYTLERNGYQLQLERKQIEIIDMFIDAIRLVSINTQ